MISGEDARGSRSFDSAKDKIFFLRILANNKEASRMKSKRNRVEILLNLRTKQTREKWTKM